MYVHVHVHVRVCVRVGMKGYLRAHVEHFKYKTITTPLWKEFFLSHFKKQVRGCGYKKLYDRAERNI